MIELFNVSKSYESSNNVVHALQDISFKIEPGEFISIMGESGCGKSTLMNILGCLDKPTKGIYKLEGKDINLYEDYELANIRNRKIGFVFQSFNLISRLNVFQNIELPMLYRKIDTNIRKEKVLNMINNINMGERTYHKPHELSGGQRQKVAIARALINEPQIILADEPTGNLDNKSSQDIMDLFSSLNDKQGLTIILVTHQKEVAYCAKRVLHFEKGRLIREEITNN